MSEWVVGEEEGKGGVCGWEMGPPQCCGASVGVHRRPQTHTQILISTLKKKKKKQLCAAIVGSAVDWKIPYTQSLK